MNGGNFVRADDHHNHEGSQDVRDAFRARRHVCKGEQACIQSVICSRAEAFAGGRQAGGIAPSDGLDSEFWRLLLFKRSAPPTAFHLY